jgi:uncharacterized metal-binding protein YceD (DUF177 family)
VKSERSPTPELSRRIAVASVPEDGEEFRIEATDVERQALARRFDLVELPSLRAEGVLTTSGHGRRARMEGRLRAEVVQSCVVTLEPVAAEIDETFVRIFSADSVGPASEAVDLDADDPPDPIVGGAIDIGEAVAEEFGLALDPYPRARGAVLDQSEPEVSQSGDAPAENRRESPFAALRGLVKKP